PFYPERLSVPPSVLFLPCPHHTHFCENVYVHFMKKLTRILFLVLTALLLLLLAYVAITFPPVMRGMGAKVMCSCVFPTGRAPESVVNKELQVFPGLADIPYDINYNDSTVTARFLWGTSTAIYRKGLGCTLLAQADEEAVRSQRFVLPDPVLS